MRIVLAEQQASARSALRILIRAQEDLDLVGEAANAAELYSTAEGTTPDLIVFDFDGFDQSVADVNFTGGDCFEPGDHVQQCGFPTSRGADQRDELAVLRFQSYAF